MTHIASESVSCAGAPSPACACWALLRRCTTSTYNAHDARWAFSVRGQPSLGGLRANSANDLLKNSLLILPCATAKSALQHVRARVRRKLGQGTRARRSPPSAPSLSGWPDRTLGCRVAGNACSVTAGLHTNARPLHSGLPSASPMPAPIPTPPASRRCNGTHGIAALPVLRPGALPRPRAALPACCPRGACGTRPPRPPSAQTHTCSAGNYTCL